MKRWLKKHAAWVFGIALLLAIAVALAWKYWKKLANLSAFKIATGYPTDTQATANFTFAELDATSNNDLDKTLALGVARLAQNVRDNLDSDPILVKVQSASSDASFTDSVGPNPNVSRTGVLILNTKPLVDVDPDKFAAQWSDWATKLDPNATVTGPIAGTWVVTLDPAQVTKLGQVAPNG